MERKPGMKGVPIGLLVVNADDWGREPRTTGMILDCIFRRAVSSVSAMVFMEDSERAAGIAREHGVDTGLHLNFTSPFSAASCPSQLLERQHRIASHLLRHRLAPVLFHPGLINCFDYVVNAQLDEFRRLYGTSPHRLDGHHHMHLCANVLIGRLLPSGTVVRRNFSFQSGEKSLCNRLYRRAGDRLLARRHRLLDFLFSLTPLEPTRLQRIVSLARGGFAVEVETHPVELDEYRFLMDGEMLRHTEGLHIGCLSSDAGYRNPKTEGRS